jgi:site-specific DNA-cytosine methylase
VFELFVYFLAFLRSNLDLVLEALQNIGDVRYHVTTEKLSAEMYYLPQFRTRFYIIGVRRDHPTMVRDAEDVVRNVKAYLKGMISLATVHFDAPLQ